MNRRLFRFVPLRVLAVLMMTAPLVLALEYAGVKAFQKRQTEQHVTEGLSAIRQLGLAAQMYAIDHNDRLPSADRWEQELRPYLAPTVTWKLSPILGREPTRIVMNREVSGAKVESIAGPANVLLFFETTAQAPGSSASLDALPTEQQVESFLAGWVDGHCYNNSIELREHFIQQSRQNMRMETTVQR